MLCLECDAEAVRGKDYCEECARKADCPSCGTKMTGVDRNHLFGVEPCEECQQQERKEYAARLRSLWRGDVRPVDTEGYRFPVPPVRFREAVPESLPKGLFEQLVRVVVDGEMGALLGPIGVGKTHALWALVFAVVSKNRRKTVQFVDWSDLCLWASQSDSFGEYGAEIRAKMSTLASCDLLLVDEFGITTPKDNQFHRIHKVLNERYAAKRPTLLATTVDLAGLEESMGQALVSRLRGGHIIELNGQDRRVGTEV